ncbi:MAG: hypothetical protein A2Y86_05320 [Candidatus Aminicenantes bacterium RBG_13_62_12]|nr:MAG: hypothetical protein A2Y86_05320 [Candidatus Aminicenantes bacterium RBG_13_62_12]
MEPEQGFSLDLSKFIAEFDRLRGDMKANAKEGLFYAAAEMLHDSNTVEPKTPKLSGDLRGSWHAEGVSQGEDDFTVECGFNIEYAAAVHEMLQGNEQWGMVVQWSEPGSGPKYLESKLAMFGKKYLKIALSFIQDTAGAGAG